MIAVINRWLLGMFVLAAVVCALMHCGWPNSSYKPQPFDQPYPSPAITDGREHPCEPPCCVEGEDAGTFAVFPESCWQ